MSGIETENIRRARDQGLHDILSDKANLSGEALKEIYKEILKVFKDYEKSLTTQLNLTSKISDIEEKYSSNKLELVKVERLLKDEKEQQINAAAEMLSKLSSESEEYEKLDSLLKKLSKEYAEIASAQVKNYENLSKEEQVLVDISTREKARKDLIDASIEKTKNRIKFLEEEAKEINSEDPEKAEKAKEAKKELKQRKDDLAKLQGKATSSFEDVFQGKFGKSLGKIADSIKDFTDGRKLSDIITEGIDESELTDEQAGALGSLQKDENSIIPEKGLNILKATINAVQQLGNVLDTFVNNAAQFISSNKGQMNAALYGSGYDYDEISKRANVLTGGALIQQTTYLENVRSLAQQGIAEGGEVAALLTTISEKTIPQFNATNDYIRRLVLLGEKEATQKFFGLEAILQKSLNKQFGESSYLNQLFDSVNSNLTDAIANLADANKISNSYAFTATVQEWLSALYEQGVESSTVQKMSSLINMLGSGNVSAMSSDSGMQKLALLAMDKAGQDYASILQNGLSADQVDTLLASMVTYLKDIATNTNKNNVLESAYANLFGISMADMYALRNLDTSKLFSIDMGKSGAKALTETQNRLSKLNNTKFTPAPEMVDNIINNLKFSFGEGVASDPADYVAWKGGKLALDLGTMLEDFPVIGKIGGTILSGIGGVMMLTAGIGSAIDMVKNIDTTVTEITSAIHGGGENSVLTLYNEVAKTSGKGSSGGEESAAFKKVKSATGRDDNRGAGKSAYHVTSDQMKEELEKEDDSVRVLKEFEKTFMKNESGNLAVAVSLQGMSNEVLKSFASIFADEDAMTDVFQSDAAKNKLFDYDGEDKTTSAPTNGTNPQNNSTTGSNNKAGTSNKKSSGNKSSNKSGKSSNNKK